MSSGTGGPPADGSGGEDAEARAARKLLHGVPLDEFVGERKRIVKELRSTGKRGAAADVARMRKPSAAAWALNRAAREAPETVERWLAAGAALRDVSADPVAAGGDAVREAIAAHRDATTQLMDVVHRSGPGGRPLSEDMLDRVRALLQAATTDRDTGELLRRGELSEEPATAADGCLADAQPGRAGGGERPSRRQASKAARDPEAKQEAERAAAERESAERHAAEQAERDRRRTEEAARLERRVRDAEAEVAAIAAEQRRRVAEAREADERVDAARRSLRRAESEAEAAHEAARELDHPLREAERDLERLRQRRHDDG